MNLPYIGKRIVVYSALGMSAAEVVGKPHITLGSPYFTVEVKGEDGRVFTVSGLRDKPQGEE